MQYKLRDMSWSEFDERRKSAKTIILPSGACEVYGPHNPLGADILVAKKMSEMLAERVNGIVGPCLEVGQSKSLNTFPGTIAISGETLKAVYSEIIAEFVRQGFQSFFIVNNHLHNTQPLNEAVSYTHLDVYKRQAGRSVTQDMRAIEELRSKQAREQVLVFLERMKGLGYTRGEIRAVLEDALKEVEE